MGQFGWMLLPALAVLMAASPIQAESPQIASLPEPLTSPPPDPSAVSTPDSSPAESPVFSLDRDGQGTPTRGISHPGTYYEEPATAVSPGPAGPYSPEAQTPTGCVNGTCGECASCQAGGGDHFGCGLLCRELGDPWTLSSLMGEEPPVNVGGWWHFGYTNNSDGVFNTHPHRFNLHQGWVFVERVADGSEGLDFGGRVDVVYGVDAQNTQAFGNNPGRFDFQNGFDNGIFGWALPQVYGEVAYGDISVKLGHFFTIIGYEVVPAPDNFFFSHAFTMNFSEPFTHTGVLATVKANEQTTIHAGWTAGWDTGFDRFDDGSNFLGGISYQVVDGLTLAYMTTAGNFGAIGDGYSHSIVADWAIDEKWNYVLQSDVLRTSDGFDTIGLNNYLFYTICEPLKVGLRYEWWKADGTSFNETTLGLNYKPIANLVIRPEIRYQWAPGTDDNNALGIPENQGIFGIDAIVTY